MKKLEEKALGFVVTGRHCNRGHCHVESVEPISIDGESYVDESVDSSKATIGWSRAYDANWSNIDWSQKGGVN